MPGRRDVCFAACENGSMFPRGLLVWCALLVLAVANGAVRETLITPRLGERAGHALSTLMLSAGILAVSWLTIGWLRPADPGGALALGGLWVALTLAFEFLAGHYAFKSPWSKLLADYNVLRGRIWILVVLTTGMAPWLAAYGLR